MGKFDGDVNSLPHGEHLPGAVKFREFDSPKKMGLFANLAALALGLILIGAYLARFFGSGPALSRTSWLGFLLGCILPMLALFPHEILHALCFREEVCLYTNWKQGMLFVVGTETMSRGRFVLMSLLPNLVLGFIPYLAAMLHPAWTFLGVFGAMSISMGTGDYYNVFNALTQMPRGARTYLYQFNSYWYLPEVSGVK